MVINGRNGLWSAAIYADFGPRAKIGEGSIALAKAVGLNSNARHGGTESHCIIYVVFPHSGHGPLLSASTIQALGTQLFDAWAVYKSPLLVFPNWLLSHKTCGPFAARRSWTCGHSACTAIAVERSTPLPFGQAPPARLPVPGVYASAPCRHSREHHKALSPRWVKRTGPRICRYLSQTVGWIVARLRSLSHAHRHNVIHRDIKPPSHHHSWTSPSHGEWTCLSHRLA
jgi:hypothetical protein